MITKHAGVSFGRTLGSILILCGFMISLGACTMTRSDLALMPRSDLHALEVTHIPQRNRNMCGPAAVCMVMRYWGAEVSPEEIAKETHFDPKNGVTIKSLRDLFTDQGYSFFCVQGGLNNILAHLNKGRPVIVLRRGFWGLNHLEVVIGYESTTSALLIDDPASGIHLVKAIKFQERQKKVNNIIIVAVPPDKTSVPDRFHPGGRDNVSI